MDPIRIITPSSRSYIAIMVKLNPLLPVLIRGSRRDHTKQKSKTVLRDNPPSAAGQSKLNF
ncbi:hypothetical protein M5D96_003487 [Drosophila gunungcola]|uniref:Uncharacterized protein n=1 Tax=Drosophila gunungcola TaxID=103775 RepID=A0A9Q0BSE8_9MUSC|nr:hypothetical protein M5D96_003487 [Drosophila gunungcola]